ncbi:MAG: nuclear transport factor 2 family protein, partial [Nitrosomonas sp.]|nr:nuclear transport factor 2 family protein [Nitrosomonas sp.]
MDSNNYIDLAKSYVELSNKHNLKDIPLMFAVNATYHSSYFGTFSGIGAIDKMMVGFFTRFPDVYWDVAEYQLTDDQTVAFT